MLDAEDASEGHAHVDTQLKPTRTGDDCDGDEVSIFVRCGFHKNFSFA
jgi:hypothetical protein